jgi:hypothetical protein
MPILGTHRRGMPLSFASNRPRSARPCSSYGMDRMILAADAPEIAGTVNTCEH